MINILSSPHLSLHINSFPLSISSRNHPLHPHGQSRIHLFLLLLLRRLNLYIYKILLPPLKDPHIQNVPFRASGHVDPVAPLRNRYAEIYL
jgi:hypothetical protein